MNELVNITSGQSLTMSSLEIAELTGKRHSDVMRDIRVMLGDLGIAERKFASSYVDSTGRTLPCYLLPKREAVLLGSGYDVTIRAKMYDRIEELERQKVTALPDFSDPIAAARAWADQYEARQIEERTKAEIGHRREATAMNTASQAVKKANKLEQILDKSAEYATVKRMSMLYHGQEFSWRKLKHISLEMGLLPIEVFDANYGTVKAYHRNAWLEAYALDIPQVTFTENLVSGAQ